MTIAALLCAVSAVSAKDWLGANSTHFVEVGNAGNAANPETKFGAVDRNYSIGKYEVTNAQYVKFMNAVGGNTVSVNGTDVKLYGGFDTSSSYAKFSLIEQNASGNGFTVAAGDRLGTYGGGFYRTAYE